MNTNDITRTLKRLAKDYPLKHKVHGEQVIFVIDGIDDVFRVAVFGDQGIVCTDTWREGFSTPQELEDFMNCILRGVVEIIVTYRGGKAMGYQIQVAHPGKPEVLTRSMQPFQPFWKRKTQKRQEYVVGRPISY